MYAQLEKSSISLFKMMPSGVMTLEPQNKLIAIQKINARPDSSVTRVNNLLVVSEITLPHLSAAAKWEVPPSFKTM